MKLVEVTMSGFKRMVPESLLHAYKSQGWSCPGAEKAPEEPKVSQDKPKTKRKNKEAL